MWTQAAAFGVASGLGSGIAGAAGDVDPGALVFVPDY